MAERVEITQPAPGYAGIAVTDVSTGRKDNLADVGFGVSQVLPIIVRVATARSNGLVLIEQPELHLHPETQGALTEVLLDLAHERKVSLLIESHSENMLLRLRREVAEKKIAAEDVAVYVTDKGEVRRAELSSNGDIDMSAFPPDFFEEEWLEAVEIARAARTKTSA
jgi:predicted ATPase